jgi:PhnB protein
MKRERKPIPDGYSTATPYLVVRDAAHLIEFYKDAFGAEERSCMCSPDDRYVMHAELKIGDSVFMLSDEMPGQECTSPSSLGGTTVAFYLYVADVDAAFERAVSAGASVRRPVQDMFWGDRTGELADPSGHVWTLATHVEDVTPEDLAQRSREMFERLLQDSVRK